MKLKSRIGQSVINNQGLKMTITGYRDCHDIDVIFSDGTISLNKEYKHFIKGGISNKNHPHIYGIGFIGDGDYDANYIGYRYWYRIFERCYNPKRLKSRPQYVGCSICEEWYNFQNFAKWFKDNYYSVPNDLMAVDKDILCKGNKIYSPNTCLIVPQRINTLFISNKCHRGKLPIGVHKNRNKFISRCNNNTSNVIFLGSYNTSYDAFQAYKVFKESYLKQVADEYKLIISKKVYEAIYNYKIDITD